MPSIHKFKDKMWLIDREKGLVGNSGTFARIRGERVCMSPQVAAAKAMNRLFRSKKSFFMAVNLKD